MAGPGQNIGNPKGKEKRPKGGLPRKRSHRNSLEKGGAVENLALVKEREKQRAPLLGRIERGLSGPEGGKVEFSFKLKEGEQGRDDSPCLHPS